KAARERRLRHCRHARLGGGERQAALIPGKTRRMPALDETRVLRGTRGNRLRARRLPLGNRRCCCCFFYGRGGGCRRALAFLDVSLVAGTDRCGEEGKASEGHRPCDE